MLIRRVIFENFGLYSGRVDFDLQPRLRYRRRRPIVILGGKNGAGKTTFLEAVRLTLYGQNALGSRVRRADYEQYLRSRIHRAKGQLITPKRAVVGIEFDIVKRGVVENYTVERSWALSPSGVPMEEMSVLLNGQQMQDLEPEHWQAFVREIVPEGLSQLFFFDGERISELAEDETGNEVLSESIKALLGLDIVDRLKGDLNIYAAREMKKSFTDAEASQLATVDDQIRDLQQKQELLTEELPSIETQMAGIQSEVKRKEEELRREGQSFARHREKLLAEQAVATAEISRLEGELRFISDGIFPFSLCPKTATALRNRMELEGQARRASELHIEIGQIEKELLAELKATSRKVEKVDSAIRIVEAYFSRKSVAASNPVPTLLLGLTEVEGRRLAAWLISSDEMVKPQVSDLCAALERAFRSLRKIEQDLARVPDEDSVKPTFDALHALSHRLGALDRHRAEINESLAANKNQLMTVERQRDRLLEIRSSTDNSAQRTGMIKRIRSALDDYLLRLTTRKVHDLQTAVAECFNRLARKSDLLQRISVDPNTFAVTLHDRDGRLLPKAELSSGEKQIYAIAMLWGLAKTSGRPLPVIIDTPLGRLDSDHRANLCQNYFPNASHQVILLSTDTEVDKPLFDSLKDSISHAYSLTYDPAEGRTTVSEGYFWKEMADV